MAFAINDIRGNLQYGGARPTLFDVSVTSPVGSTQGIQFLARSAQLPESDVGTFDIPYFGRKIKLAGNRTYRDWSITIMNDEDFTLRNTFELWHNAINTIESNVSAVAPASYKTQATVQQYGKAGNILRTYIFSGIFPVTLGAINLDWSDTDKIEEFQVTFQYDYFTISGDKGVIR